MNSLINETHDPDLKSLIEAANDPESDFPIQNLPLGVFKPRGTESPPHVGVAIGDLILDLALCGNGGLLDGLSSQLISACAADSLKALMSLGPESWSSLRRRVSGLLRAGDERSHRGRIHASLVPMSEAEMMMPAVIGDYTDFYASIYHAQNVGSLFRPDNPLLPNYKHVPIGYHGRASSIVISGTPVRRPCGQIEGADSVPEFSPTRMLDYELEVGFFIGPGNSLGVPIAISDAEAHLFGLCLVNDWSARDIQKWEYQPLGPFLGKSFATTISPWIVSVEALAPYRVPAFARSPGDPTPLPYLKDEQGPVRGGIDLRVEALLISQQMRSQRCRPMLLSRGNLRDLYWTPSQLLTHHASNGCNLRPGDLLASGTISGASEDARGCLLELTRRGARPLELPGGETRRFLENGDEVIFRAFAEREGFVRIGLGECRGMVIG
ncbi:MAG TPA: fumarylacetoacetase [Acidobacteriota bacterium]|nr:fumarylacetoacetase [Acidobacteriota bacterium]